MLPPSLIYVHVGERQREQLRQNQAVPLGRLAQGAPLRTMARIAAAAGDLLIGLGYRLKRETVSGERKLIEGRYPAGKLSRP